MRPPLPKYRMIMTWNDLRKVARELRDFYRAALACADDLVTTADLADEELLKRVLAKHGELKPVDPLRVSTNFFDTSVPKVGMA